MGNNKKPKKSASHENLENDPKPEPSEQVEQSDLQDESAPEEQAPAKVDEKAKETVKPEVKKKSPATKSDSKNVPRKFHKFL